MLARLILVAFFTVLVPADGRHRGSKRLLSRSNRGYPKHRAWHVSPANRNLKPEVEDEEEDEQQGKWTPGKQLMGVLDPSITEVELNVPPSVELDVNRDPMAGNYEQSLDDGMFPGAQYKPSSEDEMDEQQSKRTPDKQLMGVLDSSITEVEPNVLPSVELDVNRDPMAGNYEQSLDDGMFPGAQYKPSSEDEMDGEPEPKSPLSHKDGPVEMYEGSGQDERVALIIPVPPGMGKDMETYEGVMKFVRQHFSKVFDAGTDTHQ